MQIIEQINGARSGQGKDQPTEGHPHCGQSGSWVEHPMRAGQGRCHTRGAQAARHLQAQCAACGVCNVQQQANQQREGGLHSQRMESV